MIAALLGANAAKPSPFLSFGEMHLVDYCSLVVCECSQDMAIPRVLVKFILLTIAASLAVTAGKPWEIPRLGEMHPVDYCSLIGCECSQTITNSRVG